VLTVSAVAYYAAYALKGSDLRINKFDIVDIDLRSQLVQGRTWFTLFSPRIQELQHRIESSWTSRSDSPDLSDVLVGWAANRISRGPACFVAPTSICRRRPD